MESSPKRLRVRKISTRLGPRSQRQESDSLRFAHFIHNGGDGNYQFSPANRSYVGIVSNQTAQNYDALVFGDVATGFVHRAAGPNDDARVIALLW